MRTKGIKIISALLAAVLLLSCVPVLPVQSVGIQTAPGASQMTETPAYMQLSDGYLKVTVSKKNGGFLIDTEKGDKTQKSDDNKHLLYPSADYDTSYTSLRLTLTDGTQEEYIFGRSYDYLGVSSSGVRLSQQGNTLLATWSVNGVAVEQRLSLLDESATQHGMVSIGYRVDTQRTDIANVQVRILLDTALGSQDYGVYELPGISGEYTSIQRETVLEAPAFQGAMFAVDDAKAPKITAYTVNASANGKTLEPTKVAIGHWNNLAATVFDFVPDETLTFTNVYNKQFRTADSAYALYYDLGTPTAGTPLEMSTFYGVYSNANVSEEERAAINFQLVPTSMNLNDAQDAYVTQVAGGKPGDVKMEFSVKNLTDYTVDSMVVVIKTQNSVRPYMSYSGGLLYPEDSLEDHQILVTDFRPGEVVPLDSYFNITPLAASEYRRFQILCYAAREGEALTEEKLLGSRECYVLCPGVLGEVVTFHSMEPQAVYTKGTRHLYLSGQNFAQLARPSEYTTILRSLSGGKDVIIPATNVLVDAEKNTMHLVLEEETAPGTYQVVFDWIETGKEDTTSELLRLQVSSSPKYVSPVYGIVTIEKAPDYASSTGYRMMRYLDEADYKAKMKDPNNWVLLELRGDFNAIFDENGTLIGASAVSIADVEGKVTSTINISNCLDIEAGTVDIEIENPGAEDQAIHINIDGKVYTTGARTKVWDGVCAITSFENGSESTLLQYDAEGDPTTNVENSVANTNAITLLWPGAAGTAQTLAGIVMEFRYCQFGMMALEEGTVTDSTPKQRVIAFGAEMSPDFLFPRNFDWGDQQTSTLEKVQLKLAKSNYTADQLRDVQARYAQDQAAWEEAESISATVYVHDILFGGGFVGFHASVDVGIPSYADGLPGIEGTLDLHIMPINKKWAVGVSGSADFGFVQMEATLALKSYNYIPIVDTLYFFIGGVTPGINVDGMGIFWILGLGGGIDNLYDSLFISSMIPPITLMMSGEFSLFSVMDARADLGLSLRGFDVSLSDIGVAGIDLIDYVGLSAYWYPKLRLNAGLEVDILSIIEGGGYLLVEENTKDGSIFWEGFVTATVKTPDIFPIGSITIGTADLGINVNKIWGALHALGMDMSLTYYWGGDVDFAFGKYDATEPTMPLDAEPMMLMAEVPVYTDGESGKTLYMRMATNARVSAVPMADAPALYGAQPSIVSGQDRTYHYISLGTYTGLQDQALSITYPAATAAEAETLAKAMVLTNEAGESYELTWLDREKTMDDPANGSANALWMYDGEKGEANVVISFTQAESYASAWTLTSPVPCNPALYAMRRLPGLDESQVTYTVSGSEVTVNWDGQQLEHMEDLVFTAVAEDGTSYLLHQIENTTGTALDGKQVSFQLAESLPSGKYTLQVLASSERWCVSQMVDAKGGATFQWTNPNQPKAPVLSAPALGGDYSLELTAKGSCDGYIATIYEKTASGWQETEFSGQWIEAQDTQPQRISLGGRYTTTVTLDAEGNPVAPGTAGAVTKDVTYGLEAGKTYRVGLRGYNHAESGTVCASEEAYVEFPVMRSPNPAALQVAAQGAVQTPDGLSTVGGTLDTVNRGACGVDADGDRTVTVLVTADQDIVSGTWTLDAGVEEGTWTAQSGKATALLLSGSQGDADRPDDHGLSEGEHTLEIIGKNAAGDKCSAIYRFRVDATAPSLLVSGPVNGSYFGQQTAQNGIGFHGTILKGLAEPGSRIVAQVENDKVYETTAENDGSFLLEIPMDANALEQELSFYAVDLAGNTSRQHSIVLTNELVTAPDVKLAIYCAGRNVTGEMLPAGQQSQLELRLVSGGKSLLVPADSNMGRQAMWELLVVAGEATLKNGLLTADAQADGMVTVTLDRSQAAAGVGGTELIAGLCHIHLPVPEDSEGYTIASTQSNVVLQGDDYIFRVELAEGYSTTQDFAVLVNGEPLAPQADGSYCIPDVQEQKTITVTGVADITAPQLAVQAKDKAYKEFQDPVTFETYIKETQQVTISAADSGSGIRETAYYISAEPLTAQQVMALGAENWTVYTGAIDVGTNERFVVYARTQDQAGNVTWVSSDGMILDSRKPVITGVKDGAVLYGDQTFQIQEENLDTVTVDGAAVTVTGNKFAIAADGKTHTIRVTDKAGNQLTIKVTVNHPKDPSSPGTGDNSAPALFACLMILSLCAVLAAAVAGKRKRFWAK